MIIIIHIIVFIIILLCGSTAIGQPPLAIAQGYTSQLGQNRSLSQLGQNYQIGQSQTITGDTNQCNPPGGDNDPWNPDDDDYIPPYPIVSTRVTVEVSSDPNEIIGPTAFMSFTSIGDTVRWASAEQ